MLAMLKEDMTDIKLAIKEHQIDTREEFRRIRDKIDVLNAQVGLDAKTAAVAMKELETRQVESAKYSGRIAGAIAGFVTAVIASAVAALLKLFVIPH